MYVIVVGGGKVGYYLAKELLAENHEVLVIEQDGAKCERIAEELGDIVLRGDGCEAATAEIAGFGRADMVCAVTGDDEDNLVSCQMAKAKFGVPRTVARLNNPKNQTIFKKLGIDSTVSATAAILAQIEQELPTHGTIPILQLKSGLEIVGLKMPAESSVIGKSIKELLMPHGSLIVLVVGKDGTPRATTSDTVIQAEDEVVVVTSSENEEALRTALTKP
ncbi:MAG TPA: TrkA family potassium uptake protein [Dehalococcoidia bacterium]|jgi:trk system potassium uptake protein TrkA|nr:TrkA family potassium uptake protein [Dehalococcoidia bacterium]